MNNLTTLEQEIFAKLSQLESKENLEKLKIEILGKKGTLSKLFQNLATIDKEKKKRICLSAKYFKN
jgi:phenylalanyl-tRNA synthetase alpha chain